MTLPRPNLDRNTPIPNPAFDHPEKYYVQSPQGNLPVGDGLEVDPETGEISTN